MAGQVIVADADDPATAHMRDIQDVPAAKVSVSMAQLGHLWVSMLKRIPGVEVNALREWFRMYKTAEGKGENKFGLGERAMPSAYAQEVPADTAEQQCHL